MAAQTLPVYGSGENSFISDPGCGAAERWPYKQWMMPQTDGYNTELQDSYRPEVHLNHVVYPDEYWVQYGGRSLWCGYTQPGYVTGHARALSSSGFYQQSVGNGDYTYYN